MRINIPTYPEFIPAIVRAAAVVPRRPKARAAERGIYAASWSIFFCDVGVLKRVHIGGTPWPQGEFMKLEDAVRAEVSEIYGYDNLSARDSAEGES